MTRLSANGDSGRARLTARSAANVPKTVTVPTASGSSAPTPRKISRDSSASSGKVISSASARARVACWPACRPLTASPPSRTAGSRAKSLVSRLTASSWLTPERSTAATRVCVPSRETSGERVPGDGTVMSATAGSALITAAACATAALDGGAFTSATICGYASRPVACSIWVCARVDCDPGSLNALEALSLPTAGAPNTARTIRASTPSPARRRGAAVARAARRVNMGSS